MLSRCFLCRECWFRNRCVFEALRVPDVKMWVHCEAIPVIIKFSPVKLERCTGGPASEEG